MGCGRYFFYQYEQVNHSKRCSKNVHTQTNDVNANAFTPDSPPNPACNLPKISPPYSKWGAVVDITPGTSTSFTELVQNSDGTTSAKEISLPGISSDHQPMEQDDGDAAAAASNHEMNRMVRSREQAQ